MKYAEARQGRIFVLRLEDGEVLHDAVERFAAEKGIRCAVLIAVGGADRDSRLVVGPKVGRAPKMEAREVVLDEVHELAGVGTLFPDEEGRVLLHMHAGAGRGHQALVGCVRKGVKIWHILEVVIVELTGLQAIRRRDPKLGFQLLDPAS